MAGVTVIRGKRNGALARAPHDITGPTMRQLGSYCNSLLRRTMVIHTKKPQEALLRG